MKKYLLSIVFLLAMTGFAMAQNHGSVHHYKHHHHRHHKPMHHH